MRFLSWAWILLGLACPAAAHDEPPPPAQPAALPPGGRGILIVGNEKGETITLTPLQFSRLPPGRLEVPAREGGKAVYEGVLIGDLLREAKVPFELLCASPKAQKVPLLSTCVLVDAADGYRAVFSLPEVDPAAAGARVLLANRRDGKPLGEGHGPYMVVEDRGSFTGRWVRQVSRILVRPAGAVPSLTAAPAAPARPSPGGLYLVGTGPGDPDLVTVRAAALLRKADRVYCFNWLRDEATALASPGTVAVASPLLVGGRYCGRRPEDFPDDLRDVVKRTQEELARFSAEARQLVRAGKTVVLADAGDPTLFGPWGWVTDHLADLKPVIVPGISSFSAANAALARGAVGPGWVILSSGQDLGPTDPGGRLKGVMVFFTHVVKLDALVPRLLKVYPADTPVAIVCDASYPTEKVLRGSLGEILPLAQKAGLPHLYLVFVGDGLKRKPNDP